MTAELRPARPARRRPAAATATPCLPSEDGRHCLAGLLTGAACCTGGDCPLCTAQLERMRISGFPEAAVAHAWTHTHEQREAACLLCGFPPPPAVDAIEALPRLPREDRTHSGSWACRTCGRPLPRRRRHYCSHACWREHVRGDEMEGSEIRAPERGREYRVRL
jgi:ribosomal protein L37E